MIRNNTMREEQSTFTPKTENEYTLEQKVNDLIMAQSGWRTDTEQKQLRAAQNRLQREARREARRMKLEREKQLIEEQLKQLKS